MVEEPVKVSIGMPVYNGQHLIRDAIDSILAQTYQEFELIISDNASDDGTGAICEEYAARDERIRYVRQPRNLGASANFNKTFELASGTYFKWAAHDDTLEPTYLEQCVAMLEQHPEAVLCHSLVKIVDQHGEFLETYDHAAFGADKDPASVRFAARLRPVECAEIFAVIRADALGRTVLIDHHLGGDRTLLVELALMGRFLQVPEFLFRNREHPHRFKRQHRYPSSELAWFTPDKARGSAFASWRMLRTWVLYRKSLKAVRRHVDTGPERLRCYGHLLASIRFRERWQGLLLEPLLMLDPTLMKRIKHAKRRALGQQIHGSAGEAMAPGISATESGSR